MANSSAMDPSRAQLRRERAMQRHLVHLICGSTGAGKTTYALRLSEQLGAVRFSIDEWMATLFWMDTPQPLDPAWSVERFSRCMTQIWAVVLHARDVRFRRGSLGGADRRRNAGLQRCAHLRRSKAYAESDGYELNVAAAGRNALIARFHEERGAARHGELAAEAGVPRATPSAGGARLLTPIDRTAIVETAAGYELIENGLLAVPTCTAQQVELIARRGMRQVELQIDIAAVDVLVAVQVVASAGIVKDVARIEPTPAAVDAQSDG